MTDKALDRRGFIANAFGAALTAEQSCYVEFGDRSYRRAIVRAMVLLRAQAAASGEARAAG